MQTHRSVRNRATHYAGRLLVHDREAHLCPYSPALTVGDLVEVVRGNGPREGDWIGDATVTGFENGGPTLNVVLFAGRVPIHNVEMQF